MNNEMIDAIKRKLKKIEDMIVCTPEKHDSRCEKLGRNLPKSDYCSPTMAGNTTIPNPFSVNNPTVYGTEAKGVIGYSIGCDSPEKLPNSCLNHDVPRICCPPKLQQYSHNGCRSTRPPNSCEKQLMNNKNCCVVRTESPDDNFSSETKTPYQWGRELKNWKDNMELGVNETSKDETYVYISKMHQNNTDETLCCTDPCTRKQCPLTFCEPKECPPKQYAKKQCPSERCCKNTSPRDLCSKNPLEIPNPCPQLQSMERSRTKSKNKCTKFSESSMKQSMIPKDFAYGGQSDHSITFTKSFDTLEAIKKNMVDGQKRELRDKNNGVLRLRHTNSISFHADELFMPDTPKIMKEMEHPVSTVQETPTTLSDKNDTTTESEYFAKLLANRKFYPNNWIVSGKRKT
ncbi:hypothetical protein SNEBB_007782 [Seison nebaliae]|nr:hypothetical protein SNEBB_007782 [Seison nebaliae]